MTSKEDIVVLTMRKSELLKWLGAAQDSKDLSPVAAFMQCLNHRSHGMRETFKRWFLRHAEVKSGTVEVCPDSTKPSNPCRNGWIYVPDGLDCVDHDHCPRCQGRGFIEKITG